MIGDAKVFVMVTLYAHTLLKDHKNLKGQMDLSQVQEFTLDFQYCLYVAMINDAHLKLAGILLIQSSSIFHLDDLMKNQILQDLQAFVLVLLLQ